MTKNTNTKAAQHTPGPVVEIAGEPQKNGTSQYLYIGTEERGGSVHIDAHAEALVEYRSLFLAAPDALIALRKAKDALKDIMGAADNGEPYSAEELRNSFMDDLEQVQAAIARAEDESASKAEGRSVPAGQCASCGADPGFGCDDNCEIREA